MSDSEDDALREYKNKSMVIKTLKVGIDPPYLWPFCWGFN